MKLTSYWLDTTTPAGDYRRRELPSHADVAVIGAGLTGLSAALHLSRQGASVCLLESRTVGWGASGRNGGMATTGLAISFSVAVERYGAARAGTMFRAYNDAIDTVETLVHDEDLDCDFARTGRLSLAAKPSHFKGYRGEQALLESVLGYQVDLVPASRIREEIGSDRYHGAMVDPRGAGLHVGRFTAGLARSAELAGASIHEDCEVTGLVRRGTTAHDVQTEQGGLRADQVVVATSGYTGSLTPWLRRRVVPVGSFIIVTEPLAQDVVVELLPHRRMAADSKHLLHYFRITPDNRLLFGGRARFAMSNKQSDIKSGRILQRAMTSVFPQLASTRIDYCWGGLVDMSLDRMVHAGEHDGLFYSLGYSGHGVQMATHMGLAMSRLLAGDPTYNVWGDLAFPAVPGHVGPPWFLPAAGAFYRAKDVVG